MSRRTNPGRDVSSDPKVELNEDGEEGEDAGESPKGLSNDWSARRVERMADECVWRGCRAERRGRRGGSDI
jgi:hypothetical protein